MGHWRQDYLGMRHIPRTLKEFELATFFTFSARERALINARHRHLFEMDRSGEPDLLCFAAVTDDPPAEIALAGHDRCIVPIKPEHIDAWLNPGPANLAAQYAILDDRDQPHYEYRLGA